jgi:predicted nuclease of restriction endonuclease-like (RecB) superfamily
MAKRRKSTALVPTPKPDYGTLVAGISDLLERARRSVARTINSILTATYWEVGRRIVEFEQGGKARAEYREGLLKRLAQDLTTKHGRGFSRQNLQQMRSFYLGWEICQTASGKFEARAKWQTPSGISEEESRTAIPTRESSLVPAIRPVLDPLDIMALATAFPLPWSHYVRLMSVAKPHARAFYEAEAIRGGWSVRQLDRQVSTQFYERTAHSKRQAVLLEKGRQPKPEDAVSVQDELRDPYLLEFRNLKDEYSETELEEALIRHLEWFLLEMGAGFTFVARQKRIRVGDTWYRIDLVLYHRGLRGLVLLDLKTGKFSHADAGQMNLYLNYAKEHLTLPGEADPIGVILCSDKNDAVVKYATGGIKTQVFASQYLTKLPDVETLRQELVATQRALVARLAVKGDRS